MDKLIYLVRHAQSELNEKGIFQGKLDSDLTPLGFVQARMCAKALKDQGIELIISSPQRRALKTALTISDVLNLEVVKDERIREMSFGNFEGESFSELLKTKRDIMSDWLKNPLQNPLPTQEDMNSFKQRVEDFFESILKLEHNKILIVAHGGTLHAVVCLALGIGLEKLWSIHMDNATISMLELKNRKISLKSLNQVCKSSSHIEKSRIRE
ncbi:MAG: histidine phosphatase family protein [Aquificaceae bacterium]|nr:histidine phosphatase family protein [Aquificaceae bacterium]MDW8237485.1 histidine phosphatase family protein [Aquificaceae bacterium]